MKRMFKALLLIGLICGALPFGFLQTVRADQNTLISDAFNNHKSGVLVSSSGKVIKVLSDDNDGSRHQRFILKLASNQTLLIAHNIDLAPRIGSLQVGNTISFKGIYEWNSKGGVVHWTHHDPKGKHVGGWLKKGSQIYQ